MQCQYLPFSVRFITPTVGSHQFDLMLNLRTGFPKAAGSCSEPLFHASNELDCSDGPQKLTRRLGCVAAPVWSTTEHLFFCGVRRSQKNTRLANAYCSPFIFHLFRKCRLSQLTSDANDRLLTLCSLITEE